MCRNETLIHELVPEVLTLRKFRAWPNLAIHVEWGLKLKIDGVLDTLLSMGIAGRAVQKSF